MRKTQSLAGHFDEDLQYVLFGHVQQEDGSKIKVLNFGLIPDP